MYVGGFSWTERGWGISSKLHRWRRKKKGMNKEVPRKLCVGLWCGCLEQGRQWFSVADNHPGQIHQWRHLSKWRECYDCTIEQAVCLDKKLFHKIIGGEFFGGGKK